MKKISVVLPVLSPSPFINAMSDFCISTLRAHADAHFDLILVEGGPPRFSPLEVEARGGSQEKAWGVDKYLGFHPKIGGVKEINAGIRAAKTEFVLTAGNDVIVPPHWDTELLRCFEEREDCGIAALSAMEPGSFIGPETKQNLIVEGMYSPFNMFRREQRFPGPWLPHLDLGEGAFSAEVVRWEYDEHFVRVYQDSDLIMRIYERGLRSYRTCRAHVHHLLRMTNDRIETAQHNALLKMDEERFYARWGKSPLAIFALIRIGQYVYSREHLSFLSPVGDGQPTHPANKDRRG